ncbi:tetratricopeptide repeat protein [Mucilaginibacter glaciei]|uniref:MalT-like TPR region domain-containing protein n=1 Tax=Mucilaginibacter glaciei TaxID=2772109 RepID=A0A926NM50_9SPHI|nr:hypothetical protein [Mucilaginibacter glaciei]MBD1393696.1 hypothetical protein [Mucilaginibacter glaciei]
MRYIILVLLCALNLTASAQWWRGDFKDHKRALPIAQVKPLKFKLSTSPAIFAKQKIAKVPLVRTAYNLDASERTVMKSAQHNMRFRQYDLASYDFSELAKIYVLENRLSEAKWYYLQSIQLSKQMNDNPHTITNLVNLGMIKADLGDLAQAQQDLAEARELAFSNSRMDDVRLIDAKVRFVKSNKIWLPKSELRYAEAIEALNKAQ